MSEQGNSASRNGTSRRQDSGGRGDYGVDDRGVPLWSEADAAETSGRNWSIILVFAFVPLMALIVLALCVYALFTHVFGTPQAPETVIESTHQPS
ncbi:hypothetical protein ADU59_06260 [Pararhizobium polonicum]|uniref:Uncharacterized protein n=1 Tax=Pararhizobium polonicum TaxID=1612624 RepID=A0A1C7P420_9HYPH|nr:hypothetical protein [Pararhizobium polonicum]OBZ95990.1 hypothetical protein ADU59_06260 [Pararhizobium polonicum]